MTINWDASEKDTDLIEKIAERACLLAEKHGFEYSMMDCEMDITCVHLNDTELDLEFLLGFPDGDFGHDVFGIRKHLNRVTGELKDFFLPRCSKPETVEN